MFRSTRNGFALTEFLVVIAIVAAAVTPTVDPVNMALVMLPMTALYFISIGMSYLAYAARRRNMPAEETV